MTTTAWVIPVIIASFCVSGFRLAKKNPIDAAISNSVKTGG